MGVFNFTGNSLYDVSFDSGGSSLDEAYDVMDEALYADPFDITVMSFNVMWFKGINSHLDLMQSIISEYDPDVIGLQEFQEYDKDTTPELATELLSEDYPYMEMGMYGNKNAIASKIHLLDFVTIPHHIQTIEGQSYSIATIVISGKKIYFVVAHLTTSTHEWAKVEQAEELCNVLKTLPRFILMADMNTTCKSKSDPEYTTIMEQYINAGFNIYNCSDQNGFTDTWTDGRTFEDVWYPCDNIITSPNITINDTAIDYQKIPFAQEHQSIVDHVPIIAYVTVS